MKSEVYPLHMPAELAGELRSTAKETGLSLADCLRQGLKLGLPRLREQLAPGRVTNVEPLPKKVLAAIYSRAERDDKGIDQLIKAQPKGVRD